MEGGKGEEGRKKERNTETERQRTDNGANNPFVFQQKHPPFGSNSFQEHHSTGSGQNLWDINIWGTFKI